MTQPKLTAAQQRVYDWLGERGDRHLKVEPGPGRRAAVYSRNGYHQTMNMFQSPSKMLGLIECLVQSPEHPNRYIHPKFAGGKHDAPGNGGSQ